MKKEITLVFTCLLLVCSAFGQNTFSIKGNKTYINNEETQLIGLRCSNALLNDKSTNDLISNLQLVRSAIALYKVEHGGLLPGQKVKGEDVSEEDFLQAAREHCRLGVDFITVHCGLTREGVRQLDMEGRVTGIVSRGGCCKPERLCPSTGLL